jgi:hypothetical protein
MCDAAPGASPTGFIVSTAREAAGDHGCGRRLCCQRGCRQSKQSLLSTNQHSASQNGVGGPDLSGNGWAVYLHRKADARVVHAGMRITDADSNALVQDLVNR